MRNNIRCITWPPRVALFYDLGLLVVGKTIAKEVVRLEPAHIRETYSGLDTENTRLGFDGQEKNCPVIPHRINLGHSKTRQFLGERLL